MTKIPTIVLLFFCLNGFAQKTYYHRFSETASDPRLMEWDIEPNKEKDNYIVEEVDNLGRVTSLTFMKGRKIATGFTVFGASIYEFSYPEPNRIEAVLKYGDGSNMDGIEAGIPYKFQYRLNDQNIIEGCTYIYDKDLSKYTKQDVELYFKSVDESDTVEIGTASVIVGYQYSLARLNGFFPTAKEVNWSQMHFTYARELYLDKRSAIRNIDNLPEIASSVLKDYEFGSQSYSYTSGSTTYDVILNSSASSTLVSQGSNTYEVNNLLDLSLQTAWVEGEQNYGEKEFLNFNFKQTNSKYSGFKINTVVLVNGYAKSVSTWETNSRIKKLKVYHQNKPLCIVNLFDTMEPQQFDFEHLLHPDHMWNGLNLQLEIVDVYPGTKYKDTAISELAFYRYVDYVGQK